MFGIFRKNPLQQLKTEYCRCLEQACDLQRKGDIRGCAEATAKADQLLKQIDELEQDA